MLRRLFVALAALVAMAPAAHAEYVWAGYSCGLYAVENAGYVTGGPFLVANEQGGFVDSVTITCQIQVNQSNIGGSGPSRSHTRPGHAGGFVDAIAFAAWPSDDVYLCTTISWSGTKGTETFLFDDDDDPTNGVQCALALEVGGTHEVEPTLIRG